MWRCLDMTAGRWQARETRLTNEIELADVRSARGAEQAARKAANAASAAALHRAEEILLAGGHLSTHPRLAADPGFSTGPDVSSAEIGLELRASMGLAARYEAGLSEAGLSEVGGQGKTIGLRAR